ncbi:MAG: hypothetical protein ACE5LU_14770 [Anaerolineae bacterium]
MEQMKRTATFMVLLLILLAFAWSAPSGGLSTSLGFSFRNPKSEIRNSYDLSWFTVAGTVRSESSRYSLMGTAGQPDLGPMSSSDGIYAVYAGFWSGTDLPISIYLPIVRH